MTDLKSWLQSKTIWGLITATAGAIGIIVKFDVLATVNDVETLAALATTAGGIILGIIGRFKAKKELK